MEVLSFLRSSLPAVAEQVIEVPALSLPVCAVQRVVPLQPQAEQMEEVPTALSVAVLQQQTVVQAVDVPVPHRGGGRRRLQGSLPEQDPTASGAEIADIPVRGGQQDFHLGQGSIASASAAADEAFAGGFSTFPWDKKRARVAASPSARVPQHVSSWTLAACGETIGSVEWVQVFEGGQDPLLEPTFQRDLMEPS